MKNQSNDGIDKDNIQVPREVQFLYSKDYKDVSIADEEQYFKLIKKGLELIPIDSKFYKTIEGLLKFFKFSILILLKQPIQRILNNPTLSTNYESDLKKIGKIAHDIIEAGEQIDELDFLFKKGVDHNFYKKIEIKGQKRRFIDYIKKLSQQKHRIYKLIEQKTITEDDILQFQSSSFDQELKYLDSLLQSSIKLCVKDIQNKFKQIQTEKRSSQKNFEFEKAENSKTDSELTSNVKSQEKFEEIFVCCRRSFYQKEIVYQPESINFVYRYYNDYFKRASLYEILIIISGLLNSEGGCLFLGIKEDKKTYKKQVEGYTINQKDKAEFRNKIDELVEKCILPAVSHDNIKVLFVPVKNYDNKNFISGKYVIKICVKFGDRKQFYSFKESPDSKKEVFVVRNDNDTKEITSAQEILSIYKMRVLQTPPQPQPIHKDPCPKPETGKPLFE